MRIAKLDTWVLEARIGRPIQFGVGPYGAFTATLVELTTDDGLTGWGECIARRAPRVTDVVVRDLLWPVLEGRDPHDVEGLWDEMFTRLRAWGHTTTGLSRRRCAASTRRSGTSPPGLTCALARP